jgi:hypothetical protein
MQTFREGDDTAISRNAFARCQYPSQRMDQPSALLTCRSKIGKIETFCFRRKCVADWKKSG